MAVWEGTLICTLTKRSFLVLVVLASLGLLRESPAEAEHRLVAVWRLDVRMDGSPPTVRYLEMTSQGDGFNGRYEKGVALGKANKSSFTGHFVEGQAPMISLQQNDEGYRALYIGRLVEPDHFSGVFMDNGRASGQFELFIRPPVPEMANIEIAGGVTNKRHLLSVPQDGAKTDLFEVDDNSGRQRWRLQRSADGDAYNILVGGGVAADHSFLSVTADGTKVDLYGKDDGSGRQRWVLESVGNGLVRIRIAGGVTSDRKYLSTTAEGDKVDLFNADDNSGRQQWRLLPR
jgi:hypothetical protein